MDLQTLLTYLSINDTPPEPQPQEMVADASGLCQICAMVLLPWRSPPLSVTRDVFLEASHSKRMVSGIISTRCRPNVAGGR